MSTQSTALTSAAGSFLTLTICLAASGAAAPASGPMDPWLRFWSRDANAGSAAVDGKDLRGGQPAIRIEHRGKQDWSLTRKERLDVRPGDVLELEAELKLEGTGSAAISVVTYDSGGKAVQWLYGAVGPSGRAPWRRYARRIIIPPGVAAVQPRLTGDGPATVWASGFSCRKAGSIGDRVDRNLPATAAFSCQALAVTFRTADATLEVLDRRTNRTYRQAPSGQVVVLKCSPTDGGLDVGLLRTADGQEMKLALRLGGDGPELTAALSADGNLAGTLEFPGPFITEKGAYLVIPMNEGISYPVEDKTIQPMRLVAYGGHGICMAFFGATDGQAGHMAILETADDASIQIRRDAASGGLLCVGPIWEPQKGRFGYERRLRYVFLDRGGHVAMCKRYRDYAKQTGLLKTLAEKRKAIPAVDLLVGAVNVWCWDREALPIVKEMQAAGIERILWSNRGSPEAIRTMNDLPGVLTSRYDIYQDTMNPANFPRLRGVHGDWTTEAWPKDLMLNARGDWVRGWGVRATDGEMLPCGVLCDRQAIPYAEKRIPADLKDHPYRCRFIDTTTASPWRECYSSDHPMTRSDSRHWKMELLRLMSDKYKLVTGSETGHDAAVPYTHYFEGMLSLGPYRVPDSGRDMQRIWDEVPDRVARFQLGHRYRLPLWELVYHDCLVAQWYWGDYNNKLPALWDNRDLFNALYGTPPMFMFNRELWGKNKDRFVQSYKATCPVARATGYAEMTDHRFLTADRDVQQTAFANGVTVTVNFGDKEYASGDLKLAPMTCRLAGTP